MVTRTHPSPLSAPRYADAGVNVDENDRLIPQYRKLAELASRPEVIGGVGLFSGAFALDLAGYEQPTLIASTDGVGTKVLVASMAGIFDGIGRDLVNHCIDDVITDGAEPLFFLDYLATGGLSESNKVAIVQGVAEACHENEVALLGGETADMPDLYPLGEFDLAGTMIGVVDRENLITGSEIQTGDVLLGLPSDGLHTNGYSLAREVFHLRPTDGQRQEIRDQLLAHEPVLGESLADALLRPHRAYWTDLRDHLADIKGIAHITGGGIPGNLARILPDACAAEIQRGTWDELPIFGLIQQRGMISDEEMFRVFNMGLGMIVATSASEAESLCMALPDAREVGRIVDRNTDTPPVTIMEVC